MLAFVTLGKTILNCGINTSNKRRLVLESRGVRSYLWVVRNIFYFRCMIICFVDHRHAASECHLSPKS